MSIKIRGSRKQAELKFLGAEKNFKANATH